MEIQLVVHPHLTADDEGRIYIDTESEELLQWSGVSFDTLLTGGGSQRFSITAKTADYTITTTEAETGLNGFSNDGAAGTIKFTLPDAAVGMKVTIINAENYSLHIVSVGDDLIYNSSISDGAETLEIGIRGEVAELVCINSTKWIVNVGQSFTDFSTTTQLKSTEGLDTDEHDHFGGSVSIDNDIILSGAYYAGTTGAAYLFQKDQGGANNWGQIKKIQSSDILADDAFGYSVFISGDTAVVGAMWQDTGGSKTGAAYIFGKDEGGAGNWGQIKKIQASDKEIDDEFGRFVVISDDIVAVGSQLEDTGASSAGAVYIFGKDQGGADNWGEVKKIQSGNPQSNGYFGKSVSIYGDIMVVGAYGEDIGGSFAGAIYLFQKDEGGVDNWGQIRRIQASDAAANDSFGYSVSISGDIITASSVVQNSSTGAVYIFERDRGGKDNWGEVKKILASDAASDDQFGCFLTISDNVLLVGARYEDTGGSNAGSVYLFQKNEGGINNWGEVKKLQSSSPETDAVFGNGLSIYKNTIVIGADGEDSSGTDSGSLYIFQP